MIVTLRVRMMRALVAFGADCSRNFLIFLIDAITEVKTKILSQSRCGGHRKEGNQAANGSCFLVWFSTFLLSHTVQEIAPVWKFGSFFDQKEN